MTSKVAATEVAQPYAQALLSIAQSKNLTEEFGEDARTFLGLLRADKQLHNFFSNPFIQAENKKALIKQILGEGSNPYLRNFLLILVDKRRIAFLESIFQQYLALLRQLNQTVLAEVVSAVPLTEAQQPATFFIALVCAAEPTRDTEIPGFTAGRIPALNKSEDRNI